MREHFRELTEWLRQREDFYFYQIDSGEWVLDRDALEFEINTFAEHFETRLN